MYKKMEFKIFLNHNMIKRKEYFRLNINFSFLNDFNRLNLQVSVAIVGRNVTSFSYSSIYP